MDGILLPAARGQTIEQELPSSIGKPEGGFDVIINIENHAISLDNKIDKDPTINLN